MNTLAQKIAKTTLAQRIANLNPNHTPAVIRAKVEALAAAVQALALLLIAYKFARYCSILPQSELFSSWVGSGWMVVGLSLMALLFWFIADGSDGGGETNDSIARGGLSSFALLVVSLVWMVSYTVYYGYLA